MGKTTIEWTEYSWNPMRGCSPAMRCAPICWACRMANRHRDNPKYAGFTRIGEHGPEWTGKVTLVPDELDRPRRWKMSRIVAVALMGDLFRLPRWGHIEQVFDVMQGCPQHTFMVLTKQAEEMSLFGDYWAFHQEVLRNVFLGVSCLDQADAAAAREPMRWLAAAGWNTWVSHEPAWGGIDWTGWAFLRFMASGGQTGPGSRPSHPDWFRADRDFCAKHGIPWMFKQWGDWEPILAAADGWSACGGDPGELRSTARECVVLWRDGRRARPEPDLDWRAQDFDGEDSDADTVRFSGCAVVMRCAGRRVMGRLLDGVEHLALPETRP